MHKLMLYRMDSSSHEPPKNTKFEKMTPVERNANDVCEKKLVIKDMGFLWNLEGGLRLAAALTRCSLS